VFVDAVLNNTQVRYCHFLTCLLIFGWAIGVGAVMAIFHYSNNVITRSKKERRPKLSGARGSTKGDQRVAVMSVSPQQRIEPGKT